MSDIGVLYFHFPRRNAEKRTAPFTVSARRPIPVGLYRPNGKENGRAGTRVRGEGEGRG